MSSEMDKFKAVTSKSCVDQAKFFLNAFWKEYSNDAETIWVYVHKFAALDNKGKATQDLDEFNAHRFLEQVGETLRVVELRDTLRAIDLDFNKRMALIEYLLFKYKQSIKELLSRPQGMNEELMKAQQALEAVQQEITNIENKKASLTKAAEGTGVKANAARNELEQLLSADPTDLNRALITAEAALRKAQKSGSVDAQGALWWANRELEEAKKYKPRGGIKPIA
eukprot:Opistho-1_new@36452